MQTKEIKQIGWIGTGIMGKSMCKHLLKNGFNLIVSNRTKSKTEELIQLGAKYSDPQQIAANSDVVVLMLGYPQDLSDMIFDKEKIIDHMKPGTILIDHTTSSPQLAEKIFKACSEKGIHSLDAPVSGGDVGAQQGQLVVMMGGEQEIVDKATPLLKCYSKSIKLLGGAGKGQHTKMSNQIAIASGMLGVCECLLYGYKAGLDLNLLLETIGAGAAGSFSLNVLGPRIINRNFDPGFFVEHFVKDLNIALEEAKRMNLCLPGLALLNQFYIALVAQGGAKLGTAGLMLVLEKMNNVDLSKK